MKIAYPIFLAPVENGAYVVSIPDFKNYTEGKDLADAMSMARDAISLLGVSMEDRGQALPEPSDISSLTPEAPFTVPALIDVDFDAYRRANDKKTVRKSVTVPGWLNVEAEKAGLNFSQVLTEGLRIRLGF